MLLTISTTHRPATDLGYLLHKNPARGVQTFKLACGQVHVFFPEVSDELCTAALMLDIDPIGLVRGPGATLRDYVNDRPYVCSSFMSVAMTKVLRNALRGDCKDRPELVKSPIPLTAKLAAVPCRGNDTLADDLFRPLGYEIETSGDEADPESYHRNVTLTSTRTLSELLTHIYVLLPVVDSRKHYFIGEAELKKLMEHGKGWLEKHPKRSLIVQRYLGHRKVLTAEAFSALESADGDTGGADDAEVEARETPAQAERRKNLHEQRLDWVVRQLGEAKAARVLDLGCGEGQLLRRLIGDPQFSEIVGADVSARSLEIATWKLKLRRLKGAKRDRIRLLQTSLGYRDPRLTGYDAVAIVEVVEHIDPSRLDMFETTVFGAMQPKSVLLTTPNREYNVRFKNLRPSGLRHRDHRFEWTREEFKTWTGRVAEAHGYTVDITGIGPEDPEVGPPSQAARFTFEPAGVNREAEPAATAEVPTTEA